MLTNGEVSRLPTIRIVCFSLILPLEPFTKKSPRVVQTLAAQIFVQLNRCGSKILFLIDQTTLKIILASVGLLLLQP